MPIRREVWMISTLSMPMRGRRMGISTAFSVTARDAMVWLATWPRDSPVTRAWQPCWRATAWARRIMKRRMMRVKYSSGQARRISSWISVKGTMWTRSCPHQGASSCARRRTFSWAWGEV